MENVGVLGEQILVPDILGPASDDYLSAGTLTD
jgi:hypothetical protein